MHFCGGSWLNDQVPRPPLWLRCPQKEKGSIIKNRMEETPEVSSHEEAVEHFRRLLADAGVRWGAKWRDIYKDLATDGRYKLLKRGERKQVRPCAPSFMR